MSEALIVALAMMAVSIWSAGARVEQGLKDVADAIRERHARK